MKEFMKLHIRILLSLSIVFSIAATLSSCTDEEVIANPSGSGRPGSISFSCNDMIEVYKDNNTATRADLSKNAEEKQIKTLHVFFFDQTSGDLLNSNSYANFPAYQKVKDLSLLKVPSADEVDNIFGSVEQDKKVRIVAIANIDATDECDSADDETNMFCTKYSLHGEIRQNGRVAAGDRWEIKNISDLRDWVYYPRVRMDKGAANDISRLPEAGMPMIGELDVDLSEKPTGNQYIVQMTALMAKINISVSLEPKQSKGDYPILKITEYGVKNMPLAVPFKKCTGDPIEGANTSNPPANYNEYINMYDVTSAPMYHNDGSECPEDRGFNPVDNNFSQDVHEYTTTAGLPVTINKDSKPVNFYYYTYENIQLPNYAAERPNGVNENTPAFDSSKKFIRPSGLTNDDYLQRWKPTIAYENCASALILKGEYTTDQQLTYKAQFTVYIGGDTKANKSAAGYDITVDEDANYRNFKVERNHLYNNNIVIRGLDYVRNSSDRVYNFDGRVNVVNDNPLYLAIVNERLVDAHATALPMDIWISNTEDAYIDEINFEIEGPNKDQGNWIRMEYVDAETMKKGRDGKAYAPGTGERKYFEYNLIDQLDKEKNYKLTVDGATGNRSRIYFYINENVPTSNDADEKGYGPRTATIDISYNVVYTDGRETEHFSRTLEIDQAALVKIPVVSYDWRGREIDQTTWMEYYEEYLEHSDPLDRHEQIGELYKGLDWGLDGVEVNHSNYDGEGTNRGPHQIYYKNNAFLMTQWAIDHSQTDAQHPDKTISSVYLFNDVAPLSAFHYCYGKNKRNSDGSVWLKNNTCGWYMPGIRELEKALIAYYETFVDFQDNYYWSCCPHTNNLLDGSQRDRNFKYARATKVQLGSSNLYVSSNTLGKGGSQLRKGTYLRIRAFYRVD